VGDLLDQMTQDVIGGIQKCGNNGAIIVCLLLKTSKNARFSGIFLFDLVIDKYKHALCETAGESIPDVSTDAACLDRGMVWGER
jgi:hypothetical protein